MLRIRLPLVVTIESEKLVARKEEVNKEIVGDPAVRDSKCKTMSAVEYITHMSTKSRDEEMDNNTNVGWNSLSTKVRRYSSCFIRVMRYSLNSSLDSEGKDTKLSLSASQNVPVYSPLRSVSCPKPRIISWSFSSKLSRSSVDNAF